MTLKYWLGWAPKERRRDQPLLHRLPAPGPHRLPRVELALPAVGAAVGTLAHETMHVARIYDEGIADCYAMQLTPRQHRVSVPSRMPITCGR